jgi:hypothetical protein
MTANTTVTMMRAASDPSARYVTLAGGLTVPVEPLQLLLGLEARGVQVSQEGDQLVVDPGNHLTEDECVAIRRWKVHLLALVCYLPPGVR